MIGWRSRTALLVGLAAVVLSVGLVHGATKPKAWIDQPLPGQVLPLGPTAVMIHAASPVGITKVRLLVDGLPTAELPAPTGDLVTLDWTWQPPGPGVHLLTVVADATDGVPSNPVSVAVDFVARDDVPATPAPSGSASPAPTASDAATSSPGTASPSPGPTPAPTPKPTPKPTASPRPTPTPCSPAAPALLVPDDGSRLDEPDPLFEWLMDSPGCSWTSFRIQVSRDRSFGTVDQAATVPADQMFWQSEPGLEACVTYSWRVRARAPNGDWGPWSPAWTFDIRGRSCP